MANKLHVKTGDQVIVTTGNAKGTIGKVLEVSPKEGKVIVEGASIVKKHIKARNAQHCGQSKTQAASRHKANAAYRNRNQVTAGIAEAA